MDNLDTITEFTPAIRISVEARERGKYSSYLAHTLAHLLATAGYKNVRLTSHQKEVSDFIDTQQKEAAANVPIQIVEMLALDSVSHQIYSLQIRHDGPTFTEVEERIESLFGAIAHGDDAHRKWLKAAIVAHFQGDPMPVYVEGAPKKQYTQIPSDMQVAYAAGRHVAIYGKGTEDEQRAFMAGAAFVKAFNVKSDINPDAAKAPLSPDQTM